ncbi:MAG: hypothetical protein JW918_12210 [Anaerolineae bacterium]|nr:hypothetical protein [Anaerolineae bacterium]
MVKLLDEIKYDMSFVKSHTLQPRWFKVAKSFILLGLLVGYTCLFGWIKTALFFATLIFLSCIVHLVYRVKTNRWKQSWLDFVVVEENGEMKPERIGKFYYSAVVLNIILSLVVSQVLP